MISHLKNLENLIFILGLRKIKFLFLIFIILFSAFIELLGLGLIAPYISSLFKIDNFTNYTSFLNFFDMNEKNFILITSIILIIVFLAKAVLSIFTRWYIANFSYSQFAKLQARLMLTYQEMDYEKYIQRNVTVYIRNIRELCSHTLTSVELALRAISEIIIMVFIFIFLINFDYKILIFIFLVILPIFLIYEMILKPINFKLGEIRIDAIKGIFKNADAGLRGSKEIKFLSKDNFFRDKLLNYANIAADKQAKSLIINDSPRYVFEFFLVTFAIITIFFLSSNNYDLRTYLPTISVFLLAGLRVLPSISLIVNCFNRIAHFLPSIEIVLNDLKNFSLNKKDKIETHMKDLEEIDSIAIKNAEFFYQNSKIKVFEDLNFKIKKNECIGIVGESGSGKTTLVDILLGLLVPTRGKIYINEKVAENYLLRLTGNIAYLPQEPIILEESIQTNITLEKEEKKINFDKLRESIKSSNLDEVIKNSTKGLNTMIGEKGIRLSGGQNKRLALARTFYHGKNFLILDEATSSLDKDNENTIAEQIKELKGRYTIIIISHQPNILKYCDKIYKIENKKVILNN